jgi:UDP-glucose 4-epimerase
VDDVVSAVLIAHAKTSRSFETYNVATGDYITVAEIARIAVDTLGLDPAGTKFIYSGGDRGWKGDVPVVRLNTDRVQSIGWTCGRKTGEALRVSMQALLGDAQLARL